MGVMFGCASGVHIHTHAHTLSHTCTRAADVLSLAGHTNSQPQPRVARAKEQIDRATKRPRKGEVAGVDGEGAGAAVADTDGEAGGAAGVIGRKLASPK